MAIYNLFKLCALTAFCFLLNEINADVPGYMRGFESPQSEALRREDRTSSSSTQITPQLQSLNPGSYSTGSGSSWSKTGGTYYSSPTYYADPRNNFYYNQPVSGWNTSTGSNLPAGGWNTTTGWRKTGTGSNLPAGGWDTKATTPSYTIPYQYSRYPYYRYNYAPRPQHDSIDRLYEENLKRMREEHHR